MTTIATGQAGLELDERAAIALPRGVAGHFSPQVNWPGSPHFIARAEGSRIWDVDGNEYIDMMCAWGPIVLGYLNPEVEEAVALQHAQVDCGPGAAPVMVDLAEKLVPMIDDGAWALFAKNGADVTTLSVTLARAHTGKRTVLVANGAYHGALPWCNPDVQGTVPGDRESLDYFDFNDLDSVAAAIDRHPGDLAAVIVSPYRQPAGFDQAAPTREFAVGLRELCDRSDALLIHDEVRTGMRLELGSAWRRFGVAPDMSAWGKAIANGYALAALVGKEEVREAAAKVFATGSFWWTGDAMAAGLATLEIMERDDSLAVMNAWGTTFREGIATAAEARGIEVVVTGPPTMPYARFAADDDDRALADIFTAACGKHGLYLHPRHNWFVSAAMDGRDLDQALTAVEAGIDAVAARVPRR
ncbi:MAG TPA: aminotransferase class III-fold pyridoxal phosphate-dependent enzyme [Solirubrobacterales bacterium]|nr:aminotransferase class III-fold pyridoxal phosphate-dependent enzyme [Solirubrobacterales bacterium]